MTRRTERLGNVIQEEITTLLSRGRLKDPRIHELTTITGVQVSGDLSLATVYFTVLGADADVEETRRGLEAARGFIQRHLAKHMKVRVVPSVRFEYDPSIAHGDRINRLLSELPELREEREEPRGERDEDE
ncbi:MAG: 30S ribosome-binding factor RbfA [Myxococcota bacterium]